MTASVLVSLIIPACFGTTSFVYDSSLSDASWLQAIPADNYFLYFDAARTNSSNLANLSRWALASTRTISIILNEGFSIIDRSSNTFLDIRFNESFYQDMLHTFSTTIQEMRSRYGADSFVLGDDYPYGLTRESVTFSKIASYNETFLHDTSHWMRTHPGEEAQRLIASWFYSRSMEAVNRFASDLRHSFLNISLGLNLEAYRVQNLSSDDVSR